MFNKYGFFVCLVITFLGITSHALPNSIILINGTTCAGKSTTAQLLMKMLRSEGKSIALVSIDDYIRNISLHPNPPEPSQYELFRQRSPFSISSSGVSFTSDIFNQEILSFVTKPFNDFTIVEHCFSHNTMFCNFLLRFNRVSVFFVKIYCTYEKAAERLKIRNSIPGDPNNRPEYLVDLHFGKIEKLPAIIHVNKVYDLEIDTTEQTPEQCASKIKNILSTNPVAFRLNYSNKYWTDKIKSLYPEEIIQKLLS